MLQTFLPPLNPEDAVNLQHLTTVLNTAKEQADIAYASHDLSDIQPTPTATLSLKSQRITDILPPVDSSDAVNLQHLQSTLEDLKQQTDVAYASSDLSSITPTSNNVLSLKHNVLRTYSHLSIPKTQSIYNTSQ